MAWIKIWFLYRSVKSPKKINKGLKMPINLITVLMPLITKLIEVYIKSTSSKSDDKVLEIVKQGAKYLANKDNNEVTFVDSSNIANRKMKSEDF